MKSYKHIIELEANDRIVNLLESIQATAKAKKIMER